MSLRVLYWLVRDTFRQARASGLSTVLFLFSGVAILVCLSAEAKGVVRLTPESDGEHLPMLPDNDREAYTAKTKGGAVVLQSKLTLLGGKIDVPLARDVTDGVRWIHYILASRIAETAGVILTLIWTAGFLPSFLHPSAVTVLLAKPISRTALLFGKYFGVLLVAGMHATIFVVGTWTALGIRTGVWETPYLASLTLLLIQFATFFGFSAMLATMYRSTVACVIGSLLAWFVCFSVNAGHHALVSHPILAAQEAKAKAELAKKLEEESLKKAKPDSFDPHEIPKSGGELPDPKHDKKKDIEKSKPKSVEELRPSEVMTPSPQTPDVTVNPVVLTVLKTAYWILPKPLDFGYLIYENIGASDMVQPPSYYEVMKANSLIDYRWSIGTSLAFAIFLFIAAAQQFSQDDY